MKRNRKVLEGVVVSHKMDKTIVVKVRAVKKHPLYKKAMRIDKKVKAHDGRNEAEVGDYVRIGESRPYSKEKHFVLQEIINKAKEAK